MELIQTLLRITRLTHRKSYLIIVTPIYMTIWQKSKFWKESVWTLLKITCLGSHIWSLPWFDHMSHIHPKYVFFYWDNYLWRYCTSKNLMMHKVLTRMQFGCLSSHWQFLGDTERRLAAKTVISNPVQSDWVVA